MVQPHELSALIQFEKGLHQDFLTFSMCTF
jgi:hypothetical protein